MPSIYPVLLGNAGVIIAACPVLLRMQDLASRLDWAMFFIARHFGFVGRNKPCSIYKGYLLQGFFITDGIGPVHA
jgi:hypothetical protein